MTVNIKIEKDTHAARVFNEYLDSKQAFRKAAEEGKLIEYIKTTKFATPLHPVPAQ